MPNDSTTAGYLIPVSTPVVTDAQLDAIFQKFVVGVTGLPGSLVRPRWARVPAPVPADPDTDWAALGVMPITADDNAYVQHITDVDNGIDVLIRHEVVEVLASFYGAHGQKNALLCRDALWIGNNRDMLAVQGIGFVDVGSVNPLPEQVNQQWLRRYDLSMRFRRVVERTYNVRDIASSEGTISDESLTVSFAVNDGTP